VLSQEIARILGYRHGSLFIGFGHSGNQVSLHIRVGHALSTSTILRLSKNAEVRLYCSLLYQMVDEMFNLRVDMNHGGEKKCQSLSRTSSANANHVTT
jgi:hypothetical protein